MGEFPVGRQWLEAGFPLNLAKNMPKTLDKIR